MNKEEIEEIETLEIDFKDTDELELALEVSSKKAIYLIDDLIKHLFELQQENKKLNGAIQTYDILLKANTEENKRLKDNWNKLKEYIRKNIIYDDVGMKILDPSPLEDYMQELEQGSDSDE